MNTHNAIIPPHRLRELYGRWDDLLSSSYCGIPGNDATYSSTWTSILAESLLRDRAISALTVNGSEGTLALLPYYRQPDQGIPGLNRRLSAATEVYSGRTSFIAENNSPELCDSLLTALGNTIPGWDSFQLTVVSNSAAHRAIHAQVKTHGLLATCILAEESPYIELLGNWPDTFESLPKKLRWTIRKSEKDLATLGALTYEHHVSPDTADELLAHIYAIEQQSWKEHAGTSITTHGEQRDFYDAFIKLGSRAGLLSAHLLKLDNKPLAYILGVRTDDHMFLDLKESFVQSHAKYSPAHVLKRFALQTLISSGAVVYDFMGACEPYKMKWTDKTYRRYTIIIYNRTIRGRLGYLKSLIARNHQQVPAPDSPATDSP